MFAGVDHGCWSCIFKFRIQATVASTTCEKYFVCYTEYNAHGIYENIEICVFLVHKASIMENTLRHEGQSTYAVPMKSMMLWNFVSWCLGAYFEQTNAIRRVVRQIVRKKVHLESVMNLSTNWGLATMQRQM